MTDDWHDTAYGQAVDYGKHIFGVFPTPGKQNITGLLSHDGNYFESYVESGSWRQYPNWIREYDQTPLKDALEAFVTGEDMHTTECVVEQQHFPERPLESAELSGWRYEYERKQAFKKTVLRGDINLQAPAVFNRYGNVHTIPEHVGEIREMYWEFVEENYKHRRSHYSATKTKSD